MCITRIIIHKAQVLYTHISYASLHSDLSSMPGELISNNHVNVRLSKLQVTPLRRHPPAPTECKTMRANGPARGGRARIFQSFLVRRPNHSVDERRRSSKIHETCRLGNIITITKAAVYASLYLDVRFTMLSPRAEESASSLLLH